MIHLQQFLPLAVLFWLAAVIASLAVWLLFAAATAAAAAPARPLYEPEAPPKLPARVQIDLAGTAWLGKYSASPRIYVFEPDGTIGYRSGTPAALKAKVKIFPNRGTWKVQGNTVYFEHWINPQTKLVEFRGTIVDANTIVGEQIMLQTGQKTTVTMQRTTLEDK